MVGHDHAGVHLIMPELFATLDGCRHDLGNGRLSQKRGAASRLIKQPVHGYECLAGGQIFRWKRAMGGESALESECHE